MQYPFTEGEEYMTPEQQKAFDEFYARKNECIEGNTYTNAKKEKRMVMRVYLPVGCQTELTAKFRDTNTKKVLYHTPCATQTGGYAVVAYRDLKTDQIEKVTSVEWLKWCGDRVVGESPKEVALTPQEEAARRLVLAQINAPKGDVRTEAQKELDAAKSDK